MKCTNCGAPVENDFNVCPYCGANLKEYVEADDVYEKIDNIDDKLDNIQNKLNNNHSNNNTKNSYNQHYTPRKEEPVEKIAKVAFFIVFFIVLFIILGGALSMCSMTSGFYY